MNVSCLRLIIILKNKRKPVIIQQQRKGWEMDGSKRGNLSVWVRASFMFITDANYDSLLYTQTIMSFKIPY